MAFRGRVAIIILTDAEVFQVDPATDRVAAYEPEDAAKTGGRIAVYSLATGLLAESRPVDAQSRVLAFTPDTRHAWVALNPATTGEIGRLDLDTGAVDQQFQLGFGSAPYDKIDVLVDTLDPEFLVLASQFSVRVYRQGVEVPGGRRQSSDAVFPLGSARYVVGNEACYLDAGLGFVQCQSLPSSVRAIWDGKLLRSGLVYDAATGDQLASFPGSTGSAYLPFSNRLLFSNYDFLTIATADTLEVLLQEPLGNLLKTLKTVPSEQPGWVSMRVAAELKPNEGGPLGIFCGELNVLAPSPSFTAAGVVHAGAFTPGPVAPGEIVSIFGERLGPAAGAGLGFESRLRLGASAGGVRVLFQGEEGTVLYAGANQVNVIVPETISGRTTVRVQVIRDGIPSQGVDIPVAETRPGLFAYSVNGRRYAAALHVDGRLQGPANPIQRGAPISLFGTGLGLPERAEANRIADRPALTPAIPAVTVGGKPAEVLYSGTSPGLTVGLFQINVVVPPDSPIGQAVEVMIESNGHKEGGTWLSVQ